MTRRILTSLHGRLFGLGPDGELIVNKTKSDEQEFVGLSAYKLVTSAQVLALNATPISIIAAPGAGRAIVPIKWAVRHGGGTAYAGVAAGEDLTLKYTNGSGNQCAGAIETTGFLDQTTAQIRVAGRPGAAIGTPADITPTANAAVVLHLLTGEIITGDFPLHIKVWYDIINTAYAA